MKINNSLIIIIAAASALLLCQCATNSVPELKPGEAYFNASPASKHRAKLTGFRIVSVNGKKTKGSAACVPSGPVKAVVEFHWPKVGKKKVPLSFNARDGHSYFVKYDSYVDAIVPSEGASDFSKELIGTGGQLDVLRAPLIGVGWVTLFLDGLRKSIGAQFGSTVAANYIDLYVISTLSSEGVVRRVRTYPSGRADH